MSCVECGGAMKTARENFRYDACGLRGVTLVGVEVSRCPGCGEYEVSIPRIEDLHRGIARALARKPSRLVGAEIRYLRKWLGWSGVDFAAYMGVTAETVSRWENGTASMAGTAERLLRLLVLTREPVQDYSLDVLKGIARADPAPLRLGMRADEQGWHAEAA